MDAARAQELLWGRVPPGVYQVDLDLDLENLSREAAERHLRFFYIKGEDVMDKRAFLEQVADVMRFPSYFGYNWDALEECIRDLEWVPADGYILFYDRCETFARSQPAEFRTAIEIFQSAVKYWQEHGIPMFAFLNPNPPRAPVLNLPKLSSFL